MDEEKVMEETEMPQEMMEEPDGDGDQSDYDEDGNYENFDEDDDTFRARRNRAFAK